MSAYGTRSIKPGKRYKRTRAEMERLRDGLFEIVESECPTTVRHVFYVAVSKGLIGKTEKDYKGIVVRLLTKMRKEGRIPFSWISDNTRWVLQSRTYRSKKEALDHFAAVYRRDLWDGQDVRVEVWCEKDAIAGIASRVANRWCVPTMVFRGYSSHSYLYSIAEEIREQGRPTFIYYVGDYDPSGVDIQRYVTKTVREYAPEAEIHFERIAVTAEQIRKFRLPTEPTKDTDSRSAAFGRKRSVQVDAMDTRELERLVDGAITQHLNMVEVGVLRTIEEEERQGLKKLLRRWQR